MRDVELHEHFLATFAFHPRVLMWSDRGRDR